MDTVTAYQKRIRQLDWKGLRKLWQQILSPDSVQERGDRESWERGKALEYLVLRAFELDGAQVRWPYDVRDGHQVLEQIDGAVYAGGLACLVECKDTGKPINVEPIAKLWTLLHRRPPGVVGLIFSRSGYTAPALTLTHTLVPRSILLWSGEEVAHVLERENAAEALALKYRHCVEHAVADYDVREVGIP